MNGWGRISANVFLPLLVAKDRSKRLQYLRSLDESQYLEQERIVSMQRLRRKLLLRHAFDHCPYYREVFSQLGATPEDIRTDADFAGLPLLTKRNIQENRDLMVADNVQQNDLIKDKTGGSTGMPLQFFYSKDREEMRQACADRHNRWSGWYPGDKVASIWGAPGNVKGRLQVKVAIRRLLTGRAILLDAAALSADKMHRFVSNFNRFRPKIVLAYANALGLFSRYVLESGLTIFSPQSVITSAELLTQETRSLIEKVFRCPVFNRYGSREFSVIASECEQHDGMHIAAETLYVEIEPIEGLKGPSHAGRIVVTDLLNKAMPMIRYEIGDVGRLLDRTCPCGRNLPLLEVEGGRITDFIRTPSGKLVSGVVLATYAITNIPGLHQVQFVQTDMSSLTVRFVRGGGFSAKCLEVLHARLAARLGEDVGLAFEEVPRIELAPSGKNRFSISSVA